MIKSYGWTTPSGNRIEVDIDCEHVTRETRDLDGWKVETSCDYWLREVKTLRINGKQTAAMLSTYEGENVIEFFPAGVNDKTRRLIALPDYVEQELFEQERRDRATKDERIAKAEERYEARYNAVIKAMDTEPDPMQ